MKILRSIYEVIKDFDGLLFDAYGVLVNEQGLLPGAVELLDHLKQSNIPYWMLSNGSSKTVKDTRQRYVDLGLPFEEGQVITSGGLLASYLEECSSEGQAVAVLGTDGSKALVSEAGRRPVDPLQTKDYEILVVANQTEYPFVESVDAVLSHAVQRLDQGLDFKIILTNPDLFYPRGINTYGITAGSVALILEESLKIRFGQLPRQLFTKLGKPFSPMFTEAKRRAESDKLLMVGDQIYTDIQGANEAGLSSVLLGTGLSSWELLQDLPQELLPTYFTKDLENV